MKSQMLGILSLPYTNVFVIQIVRGDGRHQPQTRHYTMSYNDTRILNRVKRFAVCLGLINMRIIEQRREQLYGKNT